MKNGKEYVNTPVIVKCACGKMHDCNRGQGDYLKNCVDCEKLIDAMNKIARSKKKKLKLKPTKRLNKEAKERGLL